MNYLLDTSTFIWAISQKEKLSKEVNGEIEDIQNSLYVSAVSFWEIALKVSKGELHLSGILPQQLPDVAVQSGFKILPLSVIEGASYHQLEPHWNDDPFNGMLRWQATQQNLILISNGNTIRKFNSTGLKVVW